MKTEIISAIKALSSKAETASTAISAMQTSQAVLNMTNVLCSLSSNGLLTTEEAPQDDNEK